MENKITPCGLCAISLAGIFFILLLIPISLADSGRVFHAWWDFAHVPAFTFISSGALFLFRWLNYSRIQQLSVWMATLLFVPVIEFLQGYLGRQQDINDILYGVVGCMIGGALYAGSILDNFPARAARYFAVAMAISAMVYPVRLWLDDRRVDKMFPVLSSFDSPLEVTRWNIKGCDVVLKHGWEITVSDEVKYPSMVLRDKMRDWSFATGLGLDIFLHGYAPIAMTIIVDDAPGVQPYENRFQQLVMLKPGTNTVLFDRQLLGFKTDGRPMNLNQISGLGIYFMQSDAGRMLRLNKVFLVKDT